MILSKFSETGPLKFSEQSLIIAPCIQGSHHRSYSSQVTFYASVKNVRTMDTLQLEPAEESLSGVKSRRFVDHTLDDSNLEIRCPLDNMMGQRASNSRPIPSIGKLDSLPLELATVILLGLDMQSLTVFRHVSSGTMHLVDSLREYAAVRQYCPIVLRAIVSLGATSYDCRQLYRSLCDIKCATCHRFGSYMYLITCERVCYYCFTEDVTYLPMTAAVATKVMGIPKKKLQHLPHVCSLPGRYTHSGQISRKRLLLYDRRAVLRLDEEVDGEVSETLGQVNDRTTSEPLRHMAIISAPHFDLCNRTVDWGLYCLGCREKIEHEKNFRTKFTRGGLVDHVTRFGEVVFDDKLQRMTHLPEAP